MLKSSSLTASRGFKFVDRSSITIMISESAVGGEAATQQH